MKTIVEFYHFRNKIIKELARMSHTDGSVGMDYIMWLGHIVYDLTSSDRLPPKEKIVMIMRTINENYKKYKNLKQC